MRKVPRKYFAISLLCPFDVRPKKNIFVESIKFLFYGVVGKEIPFIFIFFFYFSVIKLIYLKVCRYIHLVSRTIESILLWFVEQLVCHSLSFSGIFFSSTIIIEWIISLFIILYLRNFSSWKLCDSELWNHSIDHFTTIVCYYISHIINMCIHK